LNQVFNEEVFDENGVALTSPGEPLKRPMAVKVYQLSVPEVRVDHCQLTQVAITIAEDGTYLVNCVAEHNPNLVDDKLRPPFFNFKRNGFHLSFRGVGQAQLKDPPQQRVVGQPQYFEIAPQPFWVEAGQKRTMRWTGRCDDVDRYFELIDRVDVELRYQ
jgi:hypothetical protein